MLPDNYLLSTLFLVDLCRYILTKISRPIYQNVYYIKRLQRISFQSFASCVNAVPIPSLIFNLGFSEAMQESLFLISYERLYNLLGLLKYIYNWPPYMCMCMCVFVGNDKTLRPYLTPLLINILEVSRP